MTPEQFKSIFETFKIKNYTDVLLDIEADMIQSWLEGTCPIPQDVATRLYRLYGVHKMLVMDALNEAFDAPDKTAYWPTYLHPSDFKEIDPEYYDSFMGSRWLYNQTIRAAGRVFFKLLMIEGYKPCSVRTYTISVKTYLPWLEQNGYSNTDARRKQYTKEAYLRNRPMRWDAVQLLQEGKSIPSVDLKGAAERQNKIQQMREKLGMVPPLKIRTTPTPQEIWEGFLQSRSEVS